MLGLAQRIANATTTKKCYGLASSPFRVASERAIEPWGRGGGGGGRGGRRALLFFPAPCSGMPLARDYPYD